MQKVIHAIYPISSKDNRVPSVSEDLDIVTAEVTVAKHLAHLTKHNDNHLYIDKE